MPRKHNWSYDPAESRRRLHVWAEPHAGFAFEETRDMEVGKCSSEIDTTLAQRLLDAAIPYNPGSWRKKYPKMLYNTYKGTPYRAHQMGPGKYHGFPEKPSQIPPIILEDLRSRAKAEGCEEEFDAWLKREDL
jgi:hypothetical protein